MKEEYISKSVLLGMFTNWKKVNKYYHPEDNNKLIPFSEVVAIINECPQVGEDSSYINNKRFEVERRKGREEVLREVSALLERFSDEVKNETN